MIKAARISSTKVAVLLAFLLIMGMAFAGALYQPRADAAGQDPSAPQKGGRIPSPPIFSPPILDDQSSCLTNEDPSCPEPGRVTRVVKHAHSIELEWVGSPDTTYQISVSEFPADVQPHCYFVNQPRTVVGSNIEVNNPPLEENSFYDIEIRTVCGSLVSTPKILTGVRTPVEDCPQVDQVSVAPGDIFDTYVYATWAPAPGVETYIINYKLSGSTGDPIQIIVSAQPPPPVGSHYTRPVPDLGGTPLLPGHDYDLWISSYCGDPTAAEVRSATVTFRTKDAPQSTLPVCNPVVGLTVGHYNSVFAEMKFTQAPQDPAYDPVTGMKYEVSVRRAGEGEAGTVHYNVLDRQEDKLITYPVVGLEPGVSYELAVMTRCLVFGDSRPSVTVVSAPFTMKECPVPVLKAPTDETYRTATVNWMAEDANDYSFKVQYRVPGQSNPDASGSKTTEKGETFALLGVPTALWPNKTYKYEVTTICDETHRSQPSPTGSFTTKPCPAPTLFLIEESRTVSSFKVKWENVVQEGYDIRYRLYCPGCPDDEIPGNPWINLPPTLDHTAKFDGLQQNTAYEVEVRSHCLGPDGPTAWVKLGPIKTLKCNNAAPTVSIKNITKHSADIVWPDVPGVGFYQYRFKKKSDANFSETFDILRPQDNPPPEFVQSIAVDKCEDYVVQVASACSPLGTKDPITSEWTQASFTSAGCTCDRTFPDHGYFCQQVFAFKYQGNSGHNVPLWRVAWGVAEDSSPSNFRFRWQDCGTANQPTCSGPYLQAPDPAIFSRTDRDCYPRHTDYFINYFPIDYSVPSIGSYHWYKLQVQYACDNGVETDWQGGIYLFNFPLEPNTPIQIGARTATLSWRPAPGALGYQISYGVTDADVDRIRISAGPADTSVKLTQLVPSTRYSVDIYPIFATGESLPQSQEFTTAADDKCSYSATPASASFGPSGGPGSISISATTGCSWTAASDSSWVVVSKSSGNSSGSITYTVAANAGAEQRAATITAAGVSVLISQQGNAQNNPLPAITAVSPATVTEGSGNLTVTVAGSGFSSASTALLDGVAHVTHFQSANALTVEISATDVRSSGDHTITVFSPPPGGGTSNGAPFTVTTPTGCIHHPAALSMSPADQRGYGGQQLLYHVALINNDDSRCGATTFNVSPVLPGSGWVHTPTSMNFTIVPGGSATRDVLISSAPNAPVAVYNLNEKLTSDFGHVASATATYTVYSLLPPDTCGRSTPSLVITPASQQGHRGEQLTYHLTLTNNDNPQCGATSFTITPNLPGAGWNQTPASVGLTLAAGESAARDVLISSAGAAAFTSYVVSESVTSSFGHSASESAIYTVYDINPPDSCGHADPTVTVEPSYQSGTQAQTLSYTVTVTNNDAPACYGSTFTVRPILPVVASGYPWTHVPTDHFTLFALPGESASRTVNVTSASLAQMGENVLVWTASHTDYNSGSGQAVFNVVPYQSKTLWLSPADGWLYAALLAPSRLGKQLFDPASFSAAK